jgi:glycosyltransferase involved in cell wall biosynthesis
VCQRRVFAVDARGSPTNAAVVFRGRTVAVVVPAYNEADKIAATIRSIPGFVDHVIVVDDGSRDATASVARRAARRAAGRGGARQVEVIVHSENRGVGAAIATGYARAREVGAAATAVMAGDGQMDPADLPGLLAPVLAGEADYAKGDRLAWPGGWREIPLVRLLGNLVLSFLTRIAAGCPRLSDSQCGYTAASPRALAVLVRARMFPRYGYPNDVIARLAAAGARIRDVPVRPVYGPAWRSGLRPTRVMLPIARLLLAAWARRLVARLGRVDRASAAALGAAETDRPLPLEQPWSSAS